MKIILSAVVAFAALAWFAALAFVEVALLGRSIDGQEEDAG